MTRPYKLRIFDVNADSGISLVAYCRLLRGNVQFRRLWLAQLISGTGDWFYAVAIYDLLLRLTGSASTVALAVVLQIVPMFLAGPTAGAVNDRVSRRRVMLVTDLFRAVVVLGMLLVETREQIWLLFVLLASEVATAAFFESARTAVIPTMVAGEEISTANAVASTTWSVTVTVGAAIGGFAVAFLGRDAVFLMNSGTFLLSAFFIYRMQIRETHLAEYAHVSWREILGFGPIAEGFRYVTQDWKLASLLTLKFGLGILGARSVLVAVIGSRELPVAGQAALGMSALFMFQGLGSFVGPLVLGPWVGQRQSRMRWGVLVGYLAVGFSYAAFSAARTPATAWLTMVVAHAGASIVWVFSTTLLHLNTIDRFRGRVFAADLALFMVTAAIAAYTCGWAIDHGVAARTAALGVGVAMLLPALAWLVSMRRLWGGGAARVAVES